MTRIADHLAQLPSLAARTGTTATPDHHRRRHRPDPHHPPRTSGCPYHHGQPKDCPECAEYSRQVTPPTRIAAIRAAHRKESE